MRTTAQSEASSPKPSGRASVILIVGLIVTELASTGATASDLATSYAYGAGLSLALSIIADFRGRIRNLVRADIMALSSFYFLSLAEYCVPQPELNSLVSPAEVRPALTACVLGICAVAFGRHFSPPLPISLRRLANLNPPRQILVLIFVCCFLGGFSNMIVAVDFDLEAMVNYFMAPRFSQPWGRGRLGDWRALLYEISMLLYLVPPIAGVIVADRRKFSSIQVTLVVAALGFTLFYGYTSGTRNIFATYLATFLVAYAFAAGHQRRLEVIAIVGLASVAMMYATTAMLEFRNIGFASYAQGEREFEHTTEKRFFVDNNLYTISRLMSVFPARHDYLGLEVPYLALIRPIPRALWPNKPQGMSMSIEEALGAGEDYTLASTFVGEAYMSGGLFGVALWGLFFGSVASWWNRLGRDDNSSFGYLIFASGFFAAVISMRSVFVFTTAILPTACAIVFGHWIVETTRKRLIQPAGPPADA